jgi:CheY-like chemotaxis protein
MTETPKILLVDDEPLVRDELGGLLRDEGYSVVTAADGVEGLRLFFDEVPDMVITDVRMPRRDGMSLAMAIRQDAPAVPITVITGHGSYDMAVDALRAGVTDFIRKPVRIDDLSAALLRMEAVLHTARFQPLDLPTEIELLERTWTYQLGADLDGIPTFVDALLCETSADAEPRTMTELSLAVRELLLNAVEHGTLDLSYQDKAHALEQGRLAEMLAERRAHPAYADRRVTVVARRREDEILVEIGDQGAGFDWRSLPDPTDPSNLLAEHGRGVLLARMSVDRLSYNETGNTVRVAKRIKRRATIS